MRVEQVSWTRADGWQPGADAPRLRDAQLVLVFGDRDLLADGQALTDLRRRYPEAQLFGTSTAGSIAGPTVADGRVHATALRFERTRLATADYDMEDVGDSYAAGSYLAKSLPHEKLVHVLVFADGVLVNGTELVRGLLNELPAHVTLTGGLAADGERFERTLVVGGGGDARAGRVAAIGLYGEHVRVGFGSLGGWDPTGNARRVTRAEGNRVLEIDGVPALRLYKAILGPLAAGLPATGLLHPLMVRRPEGDLVRTLLGVDERTQGLVFAGDVPEGTTAYFMKANFDRLIEGARTAARDSRLRQEVRGDHVALLVSCVGRRLVLQERTSDELRAVQETLAAGTAMTGFYSYGEICPVARNASCTLHNQTMTITTIGETD